MLPPTYDEVVNSNEGSSSYDNDCPPEYESSEEDEYTMLSDQFSSFRINDESTIEIPRTREEKFYKALTFIKPYLGLDQVLACALVNRKFKSIFNAIIWENPDFRKLSHIHDELYMFNRFLQFLPLTSQDTLEQIKHLDLSKIVESLYEQVNPKFFQLITHYCKNLNSLNLSNSDYFNRKSLPTKDLYWQLPHLTSLDVSNCPQINDDMIVEIARGCRQLVQVRLDHLPRHKGKGLACLAVECESLRSVSVRYNTTLEDQALTALGKFRHIRLAELDITSCKKITSVGLEAIARYAAHLTHLALAQTSCQLSDLKKFICISRKTVFLDISSCKKLDKEGPALAEWIWNMEFYRLKKLIMDSSIVDAISKLSKIQLKDVYLHVRQVTHLTLINLPEHTPFAYLYTLLDIFPKLKTITFKRAYFETDFMLGTYRAPSPEKQEYITDTSLKFFNAKQSRVVASMIHERENDIDCSPINW